MDTTLQNALFYTPWGLTIDPYDNIYVVEYTNAGIRKVTTSNVYTLVGHGNSGYTDGNQATAEFTYPVGIVYITSNVWIVADYVYVRKITYRK